MIVTAPSPIGHARVSLEADEAVHVLHSKSIIAYQGSPRNREDRFMDLGGAYRKKKWIRSRLQGPSMFVLGLPAGFSLEVLDIPERSSLLFDFRHVAFFTDGMTFKSKILKWKTVWITREWVRMQFNGPGKLGILTVGGMTSVQLDPVQPLFVDRTALIAYPEDASIRLSVYGNSLASQHMNVQWEIRGSGAVLIQTGSPDKQLEDKLTDDGFIKRLLREILPFGSVYIK
ncbi:mitochondrial biogenesis protein AIM24 [Paenibacillus sp. 32O-W]|uniref:AIM24 family protein n=1 Tax=Paenibacillus sp. 32O-W TaxID=1695218 RepID=UPI0007224E95|nr:AIM24 family protein [Paenibacillus sp. 32O-W]ALS25499.1 mitochondrial biogenesis protein AIM24 [Paenibacillus sp. 32O-W]